MSLYLKIVNVIIGMSLVAQMAYADLDDLKDLGVKDTKESEDFDPSKV